MQDLGTRADIDLLMREFYAQAMSDDLIGYIFVDVARTDLDHHLPIIGDFWEGVLLGTDGYLRRQRNPVLVHQSLHRMEPLQREHFDRWLEIFDLTVDRLFCGPRAEFAKQRAHGIAKRLMKAVGLRECAPGSSI